MEKNEYTESGKSGRVIEKATESRASYIDKILSFVNINDLMALKIVINSGNGASGPIIDKLDQTLQNNGVKTDFVRIHHQPDPSFPNGVPNPLIETNRLVTTNAVRTEKADFGVAFDGDFDRCFLFDHLGNFIPGEYVVGMLAEIFLARDFGSAIVHDPRVIWNTTDIIKNGGGNAVVSKTGHVFLKRAMRRVNAIYGGEMSAHHYFRDFAYCDSGMIPWLLVWELLSQKKSKLSN